MQKKLQASFELNSESLSFTQKTDLLLNIVNTESPIEVFLKMKKGRLKTPESL